MLNWVVPLLPRKTVLKMSRQFMEKTDTMKRANKFIIAPNWKLLLSDMQTDPMMFSNSQSYPQTYLTVSTPVWRLTNISSSVTNGASRRGA